MNIKQEISLRNFEFWSGGKDRADNCTVEDLDSIEEFLEEIEPEEGWTDTDINDFFWFDFDTLAQHLGYENEEDFDRKRDPDYVDAEDIVEDMMRNGEIPQSSFEATEDWELDTSYQPN